MFQTRLKELREVAGLSQAKLAKILGVGQSTVGMWENGTNKPENSKLEALADYFGVTVDYLLGRSDEPNVPSIKSIPTSSHESRDENRSDDSGISGINGLSADELKLVQDYRSLNRQGQEYIRQTMFMAVPIYIRHSDVSDMEHKSIDA